MSWDRNEKIALLASLELISKRPNSLLQLELKYDVGTLIQNEDRHVRRLVETIVSTGEGEIDLITYVNRYRQILTQRHRATAATSQHPFGQILPQESAPQHRSISPIPPATMLSHHHPHQQRPSMMMMQLPQQHVVTSPLMMQTPATGSLHQYSMPSSSSLNRPNLTITPVTVMTTTQATTTTPSSSSSFAPSKALKVNSSSSHKKIKLEQKDVVVLDHSENDEEEEEAEEEEEDEEDEEEDDDDDRPPAASRVFLTSTTTTIATSQRKHRLVIAYSIQQRGLYWPDYEKYKTPSSSSSSSKQQQQDEEDNVDDEAEDDDEDSSLQLPARKPVRKWTMEEDTLLIAAYEKFHGRNWKQIAKSLEGRDGIQCCQRWKTLKKKLASLPKIPPPIKPTEVAAAAAAPKPKTKSSKRQ